MLTIILTYNLGNLKVIAGREMSRMIGQVRLKGNLRFELTD